jgi:hypothetical protein
MAGYFNKTRGPIAVTLKTGESASIGPKKTLVVTAAQDGSSQLHAMVRRGYLVRLPDASPPAPAPVSAPAEPEAPEVEEGGAEEEEESPSMRWTKAELLEYAESVDLEVEAGWTKAEILEAIEEAGG